MDIISDVRKIEAMKLLWKNQFTLGEIAQIFLIGDDDYLYKTCELLGETNLYDTLEEVSEKMRIDDLLKM